MKLTGNTILITGGGSGIGRGWAEALHDRGNMVIIAGRRRDRLDAVAAARPGIGIVELDIGSQDSIHMVAHEVRRRWPGLNMLLNNAGAMEPDDTSEAVNPTLIDRMFATNFTGSVLMTSALIGHLKLQRDAAVIYTSSTLAFVPMSFAAVYSATKAALHAYALCQRTMLRPSGVRVIEVVPPWVRTDMMDSSEAELAMPVDVFITEALEVLASGRDEVVVEAARELRASAGPDDQRAVDAFEALIRQALA